MATSVYMSAAPPPTHGAARPPNPWLLIPTNTKGEDPIPWLESHIEKHVVNQLKHSANHLG